jgi:subtilase family serine protease
LIELAPSRVFVTVEASAAVVTATLGTPFRTFDLNGQSRLATTVEPSVPGAVAPLIAAIAGLAATPNEPQSQGRAMRQPGVTAATVGGPTITPQYTLSSGQHFLTPGDFATIFDINPVYSAGYTGTGQKVAIIGRSRVTSADVSQYEANVGLATNLPNTIVAANGVDPGISFGDEGEALLDVDRVIGTAPNVQADLVISGSAGGYDGIYVAALYEVQTLRDPVMNISFGACEGNTTASGVNLWDALFAQAASEGISVFVSSGDSAAGFCNGQFSTPNVQQFRSTNYICSSSYATCLGGTELADTVNPASYWSATNGANRASALKYIPEGAWNDPISTSSNGATVYLAQGTGGGASIYIPKPYWQTGTGVPADGARDLPDMSFPASGHDGYYGCRADAGGNCANGYFYYSYGTSAAAPGMAGVTALLNQKAGGPQGNMNPLLYRLAATAGVFHDATPASSGVASCDIGTPSLCNNSDPGTNSLTGGLAGFALTTGYDQATGIGSLDVSNFLTAATATTAPAKTATKVTLITPGSLSNPGTASFTATVAMAGTIVPTGTVQFYINTVATGAPVALSGGTATGSLTFATTGTFDVSAAYSGDTTYVAALSPGSPYLVAGAAVTINIALSATTTTTTSPITLTSTVASTTGGAVPTGIVRFYDSYNGYFYNATLVNGVATAPGQLILYPASHQIAAFYQGDTIYNRSGSVYTSLVVTQGAPVITWPAPAAISSGTALSATQLNATTTVPGTLVYTPGLGTVLSVGTQALSVAFTPADTTDYKAATATNSVNVTIAPDFMVAATPGSGTVNAGQTASFTLGVTPLNGFNSAVTLAVSGLPTYATATFTPATLTPAGAIVNSTLVIATNVHAALEAPRSPGWLAPAGGGAVLACLVLLVPRRRRLVSMLAALALGALLVSAGGCGGGGSTSTTTTVKTPDGTYPLTVTATSGSLSHSASISLTVTN